MRLRSATPSLVSSNVVVRRSSRPRALTAVARAAASHVVHITPAKLASLLREEPESTTVVDVRDTDFLQGSFARGIIRGALHAPAWSLVEQDAHYDPGSMKSLLEATKGKKQVVFYDRHAKKRGPRSAAAFDAALQRHASPDHPVPQVMLLDGGWENWWHEYGGDCNLIAPLLNGFGAPSGTPGGKQW